MALMLVSIFGPLLAASAALGVLSALHFKLNSMR
jgi:hypothetical protein